MQQSEGTTARTAVPNLWAPSKRSRRCAFSHSLPKSASGLQLGLVEPLHPIPAPLAYEEGIPSPHIIFEVALAELIRIKQKWSIQPGEDCEAYKQPREGPCETTQVACQHDATQELQGIVIRNGGVIQIETPHFSKLERGGIRSAYVWSPLRWESSAG